MNSNGMEIVLIAALPPPLHGQSLVTAEIAAKLISRGASISVSNTSPGVLNRNTAYHARRIRGLLHGLFRLISGCRAPKRVVYTVMESGYGAIYTLLICGSAKLLGYKVVLHHHTSRYMRRRSRLRAFVFQLFDAADTNVVLSSAMARDLVKMYCPSGRVLQVHNAGFLGRARSEVRPPRPKVTRLGVISNLTAEKGVAEIAKIAQLIREADLPVTLTVGGPLGDQTAQCAVRRAQELMGSRFAYLGPIYNDAKEAFFGDIDVLLFPSKYSHEAQPITLLEGMSRGLYIIARDVGYCSELLSDSGLLVPFDKPFAKGAMEIIQTLLLHPEHLTSGQERATRRFRELEERARLQTEALLRELWTD